MVTSEERLKILKMLEDGKITAEEAAKLLRALGKQERRTATTGREPRWLRVRVTEADKERASVNVHLPLSMVNVGLKMGARLIPDFEGATGKVVDVVDEDDGSHVEVFIE